MQVREESLELRLHLSQIFDGKQLLHSGENRSGHSGGEHKF